MTDKKPFKLNLWAIWGSSSNENTEKKDLKAEETEVKKEDISDVKDNDIKDEILKDELNIEKNETPIIEIKKNKKAKLDLSNMIDKKEEKRVKNEKEKDEVKQAEDKRKEEEEKELNKNKEPVEEIWEVFINYESDFNQEEKTILEKVKIFKDYIKPKTRIAFVLLMIFVTGWWISTLFYVAPKVHNIENYKSKLIILKEKTVCVFSVKKCLEYEKQHALEKKRQEDKRIADLKKIDEERIANLKKTEWVITNKSINKWWFKFDYSVKEFTDKEIIIYNWIEYNSEIDFNRAIDKSINNKKFDKLKKFYNK